MGRREEWERTVVERVLKQDVCIHDDNSEDGMYDLRVGSADAPEVAIECVGAVDSVFTETWNLGPGRGPLRLSLSGNWWVTVVPGARMKNLGQNLEPVLQKMESRGIYRVSENHGMQNGDEVLSEAIDMLGITHASCYERHGTGKVHLTMPEIGGAVDTEGESLPSWIGDFLRAPEQSDVLSKLDRSGAPEREVFVTLSFSGAPWLVESYLTGDLGFLPLAAPDLPAPVTGVWLVYPGSRKGIRWSRGEWKFFSALLEGATGESCTS